MHRRSFVKQSLLLSAGVVLEGNATTLYHTVGKQQESSPSRSLYDTFRYPAMHHRPFVRWWWNGNKVKRDELIRELDLLKNAGIGGVEINSVKFPNNTDDLQTRSLIWLSDEWIDMLNVAFQKAKENGMICDLIVGSGWPFGGEFLKGDERAEIVTVASWNLTEPIQHEISEFTLFKEADPSIASPFPGRKMELLDLFAVPEPFTSMDQRIPLMEKRQGDTFIFTLPEGKHVLFALVRIQGFLQVINGAPGATGPVLNHYNKRAVNGYLHHMSDAIEARLGPLSKHIRALFMDSLELEGTNWVSDMCDEFIKRKGYDIFPYLPFLLYKIGKMGTAISYDPLVESSEQLSDQIQRARYDFEFVKAQLIQERFLETYQTWCRSLHVKSRAQAYGRGLFPLESGMNFDLPECESWTMTWLQHRLGEEMSEEDYRRGRSYTMINKYISSGAHLTGKKIVSCEEMTNTYTVFNMTLELLKIGGDQTTISGVTHSIFHGFNYSPPEAPFPGWVRYGAYYNEKNNWWPYFKYYTDYKARISAALQQCTYYAEIALLLPMADMWTLIGMQNEPFPAHTIEQYKTLIWEAIHKNGSACDYLSEKVIQESTLQGRYLTYGPCRYHTLFLVSVTRIHVETMQKLLSFVEAGGRIFCVDKEPDDAPGLRDSEVRKKEVQTLLAKMKKHKERLIFLEKPESHFVDWYSQMQKKHAIDSYLTIEQPHAYLMQNRYQSPAGDELFFFCYSHRYDAHQTRITFHEKVVKGRRAWIWDMETGSRYRLPLDANNSYLFDFGPADSLLIVFDKKIRGEEWKPLPTTGRETLRLDQEWQVTLKHSIEKTEQTVEFAELIDLKESEEFVHFTGTICYRKKIVLHDTKACYLNLGLVHGISELLINGRSCGVKWYGRRIYPISQFLKRGENTIEVQVVTVMGNYMKTLKENKVAQLYVNRKNREQQIQSMGMIGPVTLYNA